MWLYELGKGGMAVWLRPYAGTEKGRKRSHDPFLPYAQSCFLTRIGHKWSGDRLGLDSYSLILCFPPQPT